MTALYSNEGQLPDQLSQDVLHPFRIFSKVSDYKIEVVLMDKSIKYFKKMSFSSSLLDKILGYPRKLSNRTSLIDKIMFFINKMSIRIFLSDNLPVHYK